MIDLILILIFSLLIFYYFVKKKSSSNSNSRLLPSPDQSWLWFFGHRNQINRSNLNHWIQFYRWSKQIGPIYRLKLGLTKENDHLIVLNTPKLAVDLLDKRSSIYSSRPKNRMTADYVSNGLRLTFMPYDQLWKKERKLLHLLTQPKVAQTYHPIQSQESIQLCLDLLDSPQLHWNHCQRYAGSTVLQITFNRRAKTIHDPAITKMRECNEKMIQTAVPGKYLIDSLPILDLLPRFLSPWKSYGHRLFLETLELFGSLYRQVLQDLESSSSQAGSSTNSCFVARIESLKESYGLTDHQAIFLAGAMFGAGSDTTSDALETFLFVCAAHPDKVAIAQAELDRVVGRDRLPEFSDEENLVYCCAMIRELLRWRPVIPGGLAHMTTEDDDYEGYRIPKGSAVVANHWSIHRDEETYAEPERFIPERFIDSQSGALVGTRWAPERGHHAFGFGRRICPGLHIAHNSLFISCTRLLWSLTIAKKAPSGSASKGHEDDDDGFIDSIKFSSGFSSHPLNLVEGLNFIIRPRGPHVRPVLAEALDHVGQEPVLI